MSFFPLNRCPACQKGEVFRSLVRINTKCPSCGTVFAKEPGYFTGAVVAAYFMACASLIPTLIACFFVAHLDFWVVAVICLGQLIALHPLIYRYSRLIWMRVETYITTRLEARDHPRR